MKKTKLPKRIAGVKVPKEVRKTAERAIDAVVEKAQSPQGREVIAAGLSMAAAAATAAVVKARAEREAKGAPEAPVPPVPPRAPEPPKADGGETVKAPGEVFGQVAEQVLSQIFGRHRA